MMKILLVTTAALLLHSDFTILCAQGIDPPVPKPVKLPHSGQFLSSLSRVIRSENHNYELSRVASDDPSRDESRLDNLDHNRWTRAVAEGCNQLRKEIPLWQHVIRSGSNKSSLASGIIAANVVDINVAARYQTNSGYFPGNSQLRSTSSTRSNSRFGSKLAAVEASQSANATSRALNQSTSQVAVLEVQQSMRASKVLAKSVGRVALIASVAMDTYEISALIDHYQAGRITTREFNIAISRSSGGIAGAWAGAVSGAWLGAEIGIFGGPYAWITVPFGGFLGGAVGGLSGYFAGYYSAEQAGLYWYYVSDKNLVQKLNDWHRATGNPFGDLNGKCQ